MEICLISVIGILGQEAEFLYRCRLVMPYNLPDEMDIIILLIEILVSMVAAR